MVKIRITRMGSTHTPFYRIVAADSRSPRDGKVLEVIGTYNPLKQPSEIVVDKALATKWLENGAQPTATAKAILEKGGIKFAKASRKVSTKPQAKQKKKKD